MLYSYEDVMTYVEEENIRFIQLSFCDVKGNLKAIMITPEELERAFKLGISFDASAIEGFGDEAASDLFLFPDPSTLSNLPWQPSRGKVVRLFCNVKYPDGTQFPQDSRYILKQAIQEAAKLGLTCYFGTEFEFYLFKLDENGDPTHIPYDHGTYMSTDPEDKCEQVRREICLNLNDMGIYIESSQHEEGPGQNEINFLYSETMQAADNAVSFKSVVRTIAMRNGLIADFSPKPLPENCGSGMHLNMSVESIGGQDEFKHFMAGILDHIREITCLLNPTDESYRRLGEMKAPRYISWSPGNRSQLIRIPAAKGKYRRMELRSADATANPYIAFAALIYAGIDGIKRQLEPQKPSALNFYYASAADLKDFKSLPLTLSEAIEEAKASIWVRQYFSENFLEKLF